MTKKAKRAALQEHAEQMAELHRENEELRVRLAECETQLAAAGAAGRAMESAAAGREVADAAAGPSGDRPAAAGVVDSTSDAFIICGPQLVVVDVDEAALRYLGPGISRQDVVDRNLAELIGDRERGDRYLEVLASGGRFVVEEELDVPGAGKVHVITRAFKVGDRLAILISDVTALRKREAEQAASEARNRIIAEMTNEVIWISDVDLNAAYVSPSVERVLGFTVDERMEQDLSEQVTPESYARATGALAEELALEVDPEADPQRTVEMELEYYRKDGSTAWMEVRASGLRDAGGKLAGLHGVARDITALREEREAALAGEAMYRNLFHGSLAGMAVVDGGTWRIAFANTAMARMFGFASPADMAGLNPMDYVLPEHQDWVARRMAEVMVDPDKHETITMKARSRDGREIEVTGSATSLEHDGRPSVLISLMETTTARQLELKLHESEEAYRVLVDNAGEGIFVIQGDAVVFGNPRLAEITGYDLAELRSRSPFDLIHPEDRQMVEGFHARRLRGEEVPRSYAARFVDKGGGVRWVDVGAVVIRWQGRAAVLGLVTDITDRRATQKALEESERKYRDLFEHTLLGMEVVDVQTGKVVLANRSCARISGFKSPEDMVGIDPMDYVLAEDRAWVSGDIANLLNDPEWNKVATIKARTGDGREIWVAGMTTPFEYEGRPAMLISMVDLTAAKQAEMKLQEREEQYRLLVDNATEAIAVLQDGRIVFGNRKFVEVSGYSADEFLSAPSFLDFVHHEDRERLAGYYFKRLSGEEVPATYQFRFRNKAGEIGWTDVNVALIPWGGKSATLCLMDIVTERKKAEDEARRKTEELDGFFSVALDLLGIADADARFHLLNVAWERTLGYSRDELMQGSFIDFVHPDDVKRTMEALARLASGEEVVSFVNRYRCRDGSYRWLEWRAAPMGSLIYGAARDITESKKAEEALRASEEKYRLLTEKTNDVIWTTDLELRTTYMSPSSVSVFGFKPEERLGVGAAEQMTPESFGRAEQLLVEQLELERTGTADPGRTLRIELEYYRRDGSTIWMEAVVGGIRDADGTLIGAHGVSRDITGRREAQAALKESEKRYRLLAENAADVIWTTDDALKVTYVSPSVTRLTGYGVEDIIGGPLEGLFTPASLALVTGGHDRVIVEESRDAGAMEGRAVEVEMVGKDGAAIWVEAAVSSIRGEGGRCAGLQGACRDIRERREAEETLRASEERNRVVVENANEAIAVIQDRVIKFGNRKLAAVSGYADADLLSRPFLDIVHPDDRQRISDYAARRRSGEEAPTTYEFRFLDKAGSVGWAEANVSLIDWEGRVGTLISMNIITERKKAEAELRHSEERLSLALEAANAGMFDWNMISGEFHLSDRFCRMLGYDPGEIPPTYGGFESLWHPEDRPLLTYLVQQYQAGQTDHHEVEMRLRTKSGEWRWIRSHGRMVLSWGQDARPARLVGAQFDITERKGMEEQILRAHADLEARVEQRTAELKEANSLLVEEIRQRQQAQKRLQESESRYRELVENANSIILELDTRGRVTFFNRFAQEFYGFKEAEIIGRGIVGTIAPPVDSAGNDLKAQMKDVVRHPERHFVVENEGMRRHGERVWISWTNKGLHDAEGRLRNVLCIGMDRTEQRRVADMLAREVKEKAAAEERQRLARDLHDAVTQTLFSASLIAEVLPHIWRKDRPEAERRLEELRRLTRGALAEMRMLLLELRPAALAEIGLVELLRQLVEAITAQSKVRVTMELRGKCAVPPEVQVALYRVAQEALNNVVKHSGASEAGVRLSCRPGAADLTVSDNGTGFDSKEVSPKSLGLHIMHERAEAVGASLKIEGRAGGGTKVRAVWSDAKRKGDS